MVVYVTKDFFAVLGREHGVEMPSNVEAKHLQLMLFVLVNYLSITKVIPFSFLLLISYTHINSKSINIQCHYYKHFLIR
jgi:hypothetical protein